MSQLFADGWYSEKAEAQAALDECVAAGAHAVGLIESRHESWGILYWSDVAIFNGHIIGPTNPITLEAFDDVLRDLPRKIKITAPLEVRPDDIDSAPQITLGEHGSATLGLGGVDLGLV